MSTTFVYLNLVSALLATMFVAGVSPVLALASAAWLAVAAWHAHKAGLLDDELDCRDGDGL